MVVVAIQFALVRLNHVNEECQSLLFWHGNCFEMASHVVCQLSLVEPLPDVDLVMLFVSPESVYLQLEKIYFWMLGVRFSGIVLRVFTLPLGP